MAGNRGRCFLYDDEDDMQYINFVIVVLFHNFHCFVAGSNWRDYGKCPVHNSANVAIKQS